MLEFTDAAETVLRKIPDEYAEPDDAGLRIDVDEESDGLQVARVPSSEPEDQVVDHDGARVFVAPEAAERVDGKELDAELDAAGRIEFRTRDAE